MSQSGLRRGYHIGPVAGGCDVSRLRLGSVDQQRHRLRPAAIWFETHVLERDGRALLRVCPLRRYPSRSGDVAWSAAPGFSAFGRTMFCAAAHARHGDIGNVGRFQSAGRLAISLLLTRPYAGLGLCRRSVVRCAADRGSALAVRQRLLAASS